MNLCEYSENEFKVVKLMLTKCADPDAFIEIGLRDTPTREKTPRSQEAIENKDQMIALMYGSIVS